MKTSERLLSLIGDTRSVISIFFITIFVCLTIFGVNDGMAQGNLLIMPRRVVFEGQKKLQDLTLANTGTDTAKYVVSFVQMRMKEDGSFEQITVPDSGQYFSDKYFRIVPRTVTLAPKEAQVVKMQLLKSSKLTQGEYRSHIYFRSIPKEKPLGEEVLKDTTTVSVHLIPIFGITIPAIIRVGECSAKVNIKEIGIEKVNDTLNRLQMKLFRTGNISVYGDMTVNHISPNGKVTRVALVKGLAVYTPNTFRRFQCSLNNIPGIDYHVGKLQVIYSALEDVKSTALAEGELILH